MRRSPLFYAMLLALSVAILVVGTTAQDSADPSLYLYPGAPSTQITSGSCAAHPGSDARGACVSSCRMPPRVVRGIGGSSRRDTVCQTPCATLSGALTSHPGHDAARRDRLADLHDQSLAVDRLDQIARRAQS